MYILALKRLAKQAGNFISTNNVNDKISKKIKGMFHAVPYPLFFCFLKYS